MPQMHVRFKDAIHEKLQALAALDGVSATAVLSSLVSRAHEERMGSKPEPRRAGPQRNAPGAAASEPARLPPGRFASEEEAMAYARANGPVVTTTIEPDANTTLIGYTRLGAAHYTPEPPHPGPAFNLADAPPEHLEHLLGELKFDDE